VLDHPTAPPPGTIVGSPQLHAPGVKFGVVVAPEPSERTKRITSDNPAIWRPAVAELAATVWSRDEDKATKVREAAQLERWGRTGLAILSVKEKPLPFLRCELPRSATVKQLVAHCARIPDAALRLDFEECVLDEARTPSEREQLRLYYRARADHPTFDPKIRRYKDAEGEWHDRPLTANNHHHVESTWERQTAPVLAPAVRRCQAPGCDRTLSDRQQRTCGSRCRKALSRAQKV
jgi:hypothetical protein